MNDTWARKKAKTRHAIQEAALRLFVEQGFEATTVAQIAASAGVSHMTFFRHFPTKEDVVMLDDFDPMIEALIRAQPADLPPVVRVQRAFVQAFGVLDADARAEQLIRLRLVLSAPALRARIWENQRVTQEMLERALFHIPAESTDDGGAPARADVEAGVLRARVVAAACTATLITALLAWAESGDATDPGRLVDQAFTALQKELA